MSLWLKSTDFNWPRTHKDFKENSQPLNLQNFFNTLRHRSTVLYAYRMKYRIEAYFMPKEKALIAERSMRQGANAEVYLLGSGKASIAKLNCKSGDC